MLGAIVGDVLGSSYEFEEMKFDWVLPHNENLKDIPLFNDDDQFTDDTVLSLAVADWLLHDIQKDYYDDEKLKIALGNRMVWWTQFYREREIAYGLFYLDFFYRTELIQEYIPQSSCGNGSAMRVSPVGWFLILWKKPCGLPRFQQMLRTIIQKVKKVQCILLLPYI